MAREIDALTSPTLKHLRDRWWDESFDAFLDETLRPRPGCRILDVGCGAGAAEVHLGTARLPGVALVGIDIDVARLREARAIAAVRDVALGLVGATAASLPFVDATFDSAFCVAVLQHLAEPLTAIRELARVTKPGGRVAVVEPDNDASYWYSSAGSGASARRAATVFFDALERSTGLPTDPVLGPKVPSLCLRAGIQPLAVRLFPASVSRLGDLSLSMWEARLLAARRLVESTTDAGARASGAEYLACLDRYAEEASSQGAGFVEIQNTMLVATIGHRVAP